MEIVKTIFNDCFLIKPRVFKDNRGFFLETYSEKKFKELGITSQFCQDNHSLSATAGVVRGLHFQHPPHAQAKLVRVTRGSVFDVVVDLRKKSPTFGQWDGVTLTAENFLMLYIPRGFAHGFCTLSDSTEFMYKNDNPYTPESEGSLLWNDPQLNISWPVKEPVLSDKDAMSPLLKDFVSPF